MTPTRAHDVPTGGNPRSCFARQSRTAVALAAGVLAGLVLGAAHAGQVVGANGEVFTGNISFAPPDAVVVSDGTSAVRRIAFEQITQAFCAPDSHVLNATNGAWESRDIGEVYRPGSTLVTNGAFTLRASGWGFWPSADGFRFVYRPISGDAQVVVHVADLASERGEVQAGISFRERTEATSAHATLLLVSEDKFRFECRPIKQGQYPQTHATQRQRWLRLARQGDRFTAYLSADQTNWVPVAERTVPMKADVLAGLVVATRVNSSLAGARLDGLQILAGAGAAAAFGDLPRQGVVLRDGSVLAGHPAGADTATLQLVRPAAQTMAIALPQIAAVLFQAAPPEVAPGARTSGPAVLLFQNGDRVEGEFSGIANGRVALKSVLFGIKHYPLTNHVSSLVLAGVGAAAAPARWHLRLRDGSRLRCASVKLEDNGLVAEHPLLGPVRLPFEELLELKGTRADAQ